MAHKSAPNPNTQIPNPETTPQTQAPTKPQENPKMSLEEKLKKLMESMQDWERKKIVETPNITVELVKLPKRETKKRTIPERLVLHVKRSNSFRGIIIDNMEVLEDLIKVLSNPKIRTIATALDTINGSTETIELEL
jgi:hypothetical protein